MDRIKILQRFFDDATPEKNRRSRNYISASERGLPLLHFVLFAKLYFIRALIPSFPNAFLDLGLPSPSCVRVLHPFITPPPHSSITLSPHHPITPSLHSSTTPPLHSSITPSLHSSITPFPHHSIPSFPHSPIPFI